ncbi:MAG TPA: hypothetical protein VH418_00840 [Solirubrobacteraceae bacterium]|jgi:hypothetical protein
MLKLTWMRRRSLAVAGACAATLCTAAPALAADPPPPPSNGPAAVMAKVTWGSTLECAAPQYAQTLAGFGDRRWYVQAPGGDFSSASAGGWQFSGGASLVADSHDGDALDLPAGSVAVSPAMCVDLSYPTARMWARNVSGKANVNVGVAYAGTKTATAPHWVGGLKPASSAWTLSKDFAVQPQTAGKADGWRMVAFVFVADKGGDARIDDFYVDPRFRT